jgi:hypothetical protein
LRPPGSLEAKKEISNTNSKIRKNYNFTNIIINIPPIINAQINQKTREKQEIREVTSPIIAKMKY